MRSIKLVVSSILLALFCTGIAHAKGPEFQPREEWLGMYIQKGKVGYKHIVIKKDVLDGKPVYRRDEYLRIRGNDVIDSRFTLFCDEQYKPIVTDWEIIELGRKRSGEWTYSDKAITMLETNSVDGSMASQVQQLPGSAGDMSASCRFAMGTWPIQTKDTIFQCTGYFRLSMISEPEMTPAHLMLVADKTEKVTVAGKEYETFVIDHIARLDRQPDGRIAAVSSGYKSWALENGEIIKESFDSDGVALQEWVKTTREDAMEGIGDVGVRESPYAGDTIKSSQYIPNSHELVELHCKMPGLTPMSIMPDDEVQTCKYDEATQTAEFHIKYIPVDESKAPQIPIKGNQFAKYLGEVPGLQVNQKDIKELAYSIIGNEKNSWRASLLIRRWCIENMPYSLEINPPHNAEDIKNLLIGCCRHYAILYCVLARAVGIPTKMTQGVAYVGSGFGPHAWCESYFGHWVIVDATWSLEQASAGYIRLDDVEKPKIYGYGFRASNLVEILDYKRMTRKAPSIFDSQPRKVPDLPKDPASLIHEEWRGIYLGAIKIGYTHSAVSKDMLNGSDVYRKDESLKIRMKSTSDPGTALVDYQCTTFADKRFNPLFSVGKKILKKTGLFFRPPVKPNQQFRPDEDYVFELAYGKLGCFESRWENGVKTDDGTNWPLLPEQMIPDGVAYDFGLKKLKVGEQFPAGHRRFRDVVIFNGNIYIDDMAGPQTADAFWDTIAKVNVLRREKVTLDGKTYDTTLVQDKGGAMGETITRWYLDNGTLLKSEHNLGIRTEKESREEAMKGIEGDGPDVSTVAVDKTIPDPDRVVEATIKLKGAWSNQLALTLRGQTARNDEKNQVITFTEVAKRDFDAKKAVILPVQDTDQTQFLVQEAAVNTSDPDIVAKAKEIAGGETNAYKVACALRKWVFENIRLDMNTKVESESCAVLKAGEGNRSGRNVLFVTMARALGLPARFVGGLRYENTRYYWDIWAELYVGEWIPMDASASTDYVDATHLWFTNGEFLDVKQLGKIGMILGSVKAEVVRYKTIDGKVVDFSVQADESKPGTTTNTGSSTKFKAKPKKR